MGTLRTGLWLWKRVEKRNLLGLEEGAEVSAGGSGSLPSLPGVLPDMGGSGSFMATLS